MKVILNNSKIEFRSVGHGPFVINWKNQNKYIPIPLFVSSGVVIYKGYKVTITESASSIGNNYSLISCSAGDRYRVFANGDLCVCCILDENDCVLEYYNSGPDSTNRVIEGQTLPIWEKGASEIEITAPEGAKKVIFNGKTPPIALYIQNP